MEPIKNFNAALIAPFLTLIFLALPVSAYADWSNAGVQPGLTPHFNPVLHVEPQHRVEPPPRTVVNKIQHVINHSQPNVRHDQLDFHHRTTDSHIPGYFRRDTDYYGHAVVVLPYADVDSPFVVPDGFEPVMVNGETFYYNQGAFYQQVGDQLEIIPPVVGAVVDNIPEDYQIVMADGIHYLFTRGVYYQRVDQGFAVVVSPMSDQE